MNAPRSGLNRYSRGNRRSNSAGTGDHHQARSDSEADTDASVDVASVQWSPRVDGPQTTHGACREQERIPSRLPHTRELFSVHEQAHATELLLSEELKDHVRLAHHPIRICVDTLPAGAVPLDSNAYTVVTYNRRTSPPLPVESGYCSVPNHVP
jgi:hypothetical protein